MHGQIKCQCCNTLISQCRCPAHTTTIKYRICDTCQYKTHEFYVTTNTTLDELEAWISRLPYMDSPGRIHSLDRTRYIDIRYDNRFIISKLLQILEIIK